MACNFIFFFSSLNIILDYLILAQVKEKYNKTKFGMDMVQDNCPTEDMYIK